MAEGTLEIQMRHDASKSEYHGNFDCYPGQKIELKEREAIEVCRKFPDMFIPVGWDLKGEIAKVESVDKSDWVTLQLKYNPRFESYHSADGLTFDKVGSFQDVPFQKAKDLLVKFPGVFELITDNFRGEDDEAEELGDGMDEMPVRTEEDIIQTIDEAIVALVSDTPATFNEMKQQLGEWYDPKTLQRRLMSLMRSKQIKKGEDGKWRHVFTENQTTSSEE